MMKTKSSGAVNLGRSRLLAGRFADQFRNLPP
jgi:hypothetical protein